MNPKRHLELARARRRYVVFGCCSSVALPFATEAAAAQSANSDLIGSLYAQLLAVAVPVTLVVLAGLVYASVRFRAADEPRTESDPGPGHDPVSEPQPTAEKPVLEIAWVAATVAVLLAVGLAAYPVLATPYLSPGIPAGEDGDGGPNPDENETVNTEIEVVAAQWTWRFAYPDANVTTRGELVIPADEDVRLVATSRDVVHAFAVPELGVKQDVFPGEEAVIRTHVHERGTYRAQCTAFCGTDHAGMTATVTVVDRETYDAWLEAHAGEDGVTEPPEPTSRRR